MNKLHLQDGCIKGLVLNAVAILPQASQGEALVSVLLNSWVLWTKNSYLHCLCAIQKVLTGLWLPSMQ